jgi:hypothetical protein
MGLFAFTARTFAVVNAATDSQVGPGGAGSTFTPTYVVSNSDLIQGLLPTASSGDYAVELSGGLPVLTDGTFGTITEPGGAPDRTHFAFAVAGGGSGTGTTLTYSLNTAASPAGYNLSSINTYGGWNDNGRDQQAYTVSYSTVANPATFIDLIAVDFNPTVANNLQSANSIIIIEKPLLFLATNVGAVRFNFSPATENGYSGYAEIDVLGSPVPEPATAALLATTSLALLARRRRR